MVERWKKQERISKKKIHDLFKRQDKLKDHDIYGFDLEKQINWCKLKLSKTGYFMPKIWLSVFGPIFMCKRVVMSFLDGTISF